MTSIKDIKTDISTNSISKPDAMEKLRSALFHNSWGNTLRTILTFGVYYFTTLTQEAKQHYKEAREQPKAQHFSDLAKHIQDIKRATVPTDVSTPRGAIKYILTELKKNDSSKWYNDDILVGAILAVNVGETRFTGSAWAVLKKEIRDASNGIVDGENIPLQRKLAMLPQLVGTIKSLKKDNKGYGEIRKTLFALPECATRYTNDEILSIFANPDKFKNVPMSTTEKAWRTLVGLPPATKPYSGMNDRLLVHNFSVSPQHIEKVKNPNLYATTIPVTLGDLTSSDLLRRYQDHDENMAKQKIEHLSKLLTAVKNRRETAMKKIDKDLGLNGHIDLSNCAPNTPEAQKKYHAEIDRYIDSTLSPHASHWAKDLVRTHLMAELESVPSFLYLLSNKIADKKNKEIFHGVYNSSELRQIAQNPDAFATLSNSQSGLKFPTQAWSNALVSAKAVRKSDHVAPISSDQDPLVDNLSSETLDSQASADQKKEKLPFLLAAIETAKVESMQRIETDIKEKWGNSIDLSHCAPTSKADIKRLFESVEQYLDHTLVSADTAHLAKDALKDTVIDELAKVPERLLIETQERVIKANKEFADFYTPAEIRQIIQTPGSFSNPDETWPKMLTSAEQIGKKSVTLSKNLIRAERATKAIGEAFRRSNFAQLWTDERNNVQDNTEWMLLSLEDLTQNNISHPDQLLEQKRLEKKIGISHLPDGAILTTAQFMKDFLRIVSAITFKNVHVLLKDLEAQQDRTVIIQDLPDTHPCGTKKTVQETLEINQDRYQQLISFLSQIDQTQGGLDHSLIQNIQVLLSQTIKNSIWRPIKNHLDTDPFLNLGDEFYTFNMESPTKIHLTHKQYGTLSEAGEKGCNSQIGTFETTMELDLILDEKSGSWVIRNVALTECKANVL